MIELPEGLMSYLQSEEMRARDDSLNEERKVALDFYNGKPFGDEVEGRSQLVTRDVAEVVDYMTVAVVRTVVSDKVVEFEARRQEDREAAKDATELVAWQFMRQQSGYRIVHDALKAGLLEKTGVLKTWVELGSDVVEGEAIASEVEADDTIIAAEEQPGRVAVGPDGETLEQVYSVRRRVPAPPKFMDAAVPNEEFGFSPEARELDEARYIGHRTRATLASLIARFNVPAADSETLWGAAQDGQQLSDARDNARSRKDSENTQAQGVSRQVWLNEEYVRWDWNGDGEEELLCVHRVGSKALSIIEVDEQPFVIWCPFPMAHRIVGQSLADKTMDIQRIRSILLRQAMDALYFANAPRPLVETTNMDENTLDDILTTVPGSPIRYKGTAPLPMQMPFAAPHAFTALEFMTGERESRTGITRHNQGINADTLNNTATGYKLQIEAGAQIEEYVARNFAEALAELFEKKARLMRQHNAVEQVRVGGEFKTVSAGDLPEDMDMGIRVGLGTGSKDKRIASRMMVLELQKEAMAQGLGLVDEAKLYASAAGVVSETGLGDANIFFNDPSTQGPKPPKRDPAEIEAEGKVQVEMQRQQQAHERAMFDAETARIKMEAQAGIDRERAEFEAQLARDKADFEADMARDQREFEQSMLLDRIASETNAPTIPANRPGGRLDA